MKILVCGASGFIGKSICDRLIADGHEVVRGLRQASAPGEMAIDFGKDVSVAAWRGRLDGFDVVVNAVGIIVERAAARFDDIHRKAPAALFAACAQAGVRRVVQISALGAGDGTTRYFRSKNAADRYLAGLPIEWQILRPALVYGEDGVSAGMFRMIASLPVMLVPELGAAMFQPIHIDDLTEAVAAAIGPTTAAGQCVDLVGASRVSYRAMLETYRCSMGFSAAPCLAVPAPLMALAATVCGRIPGALLNRENWRMLRSGSVGDVSATIRCLGRAPKGVEQFIPAARAEVLARRALAAWRNRLLRYVLAVVWCVTAYVSLFAYPVSGSLDLLARVGLAGWPATVALHGASACDFLMGVACIASPGRRLWLAQAGLILGYTAIVSLAMPEFWMHPFGPLLKNLPILAILFVLFAEEK